VTRWPAPQTIAATRRLRIDPLPAALVLGGLVLGLALATEAAASSCGDATAASSPRRAATPVGSAPAALDLVALETRLRETRAIGVFTKLSLKNQVDDLLEQFHRFHDGRGTRPLSRLREEFDLLVLKVLSLVQDRDAPLAGDIAASREALWKLLADPRTFWRLRTEGRIGA
jgi:hypothetical protein